jgi:Nucleotidyl transferase AbiEii toxin, Type IV TA system
VNPSFERFLRLPEGDRVDVFAAAAQRLGTLPSYVEKDFWVCLVLDALYNGLPAGHPRLLFKGGTSLSKAFGLIRRFSEDIDIVVFRTDLGFADERDPANAHARLSGKKRERLFDELKTACGEYIAKQLASALTTILDGFGAVLRVFVDETDADRQTLLLAYVSAFDTGEPAYVLPRVKIESGARSALDPHLPRTIAPFVADELAGWDLAAGGITTIEPARTFWEKMLILHGTHCGYRDEGRLPADRDRISRHYYDVAMISETEIGRSALNDHDLWTAVRDHNQIAFRQGWKKFDEAIVGSTRIVPQLQLRAEIEKDYSAMQGMILGDAPAFSWIIKRLEEVERAINQK